MNVEVCRPNFEHRPIIKNLCVFDRYDLMPFIENGDGSNVTPLGTLGGSDATNHDESVADQDIWWTKPDILLPMLIRFQDLPAGFAMIARPPHAHRSVDYRLEDFFVLNKLRRAGIGRSAVSQIFQRHPGRWELGWLPKNTLAEAFWRSVTAAHRPEDWVVEQAPGAPRLPGLRMTVA